MAISKVCVVSEMDLKGVERKLGLGNGMWVNGDEYLKQKVKMILGLGGNGFMLPSPPYKYPLKTIRMSIRM